MRNNMVWKIFAVLLAVALLPLNIKSFAENNSQSGIDFFNNEYAAPHQLEYESAPKMVDAMELAASEGNLELYFDKTNLCIAVRRKDTGSIFLSNPYDADLSGKAGEVLDKLKSQIVITYYNLQQDLSTKYSFADAVTLGQYNIEPVKNGIEVSLMMGEDVSNDIIPLCLPKGSMQDILDGIDDPEQSEIIKSYYSLTALKDVTAYAGGLQYLNETAANSNAEVYVFMGGLSPAEKGSLIKHLSDSGYTMKKKNNDYTSCGLQEIARTEPACFKIKVIYKLENGCLKAEVPSSSISYNENLYQIDKIDVLPMFGASSFKESPDGYLFLPDGCGAVLNFNDNTPGKTAVVSNRIYNTDTSIDYTMPPDFSQNYYIPVFGIKTSRDCVMAVVEDGKTMAGISTSLGGIISEYFSVNAYFTLYASDIIVLSKEKAVVAATGEYSGSKAVKYDKNKYEGNYSVKYYFLNGENANYTGMADEYREYLKNHEGAKQITNTLRFGLQTIGTVSTADTFLGFPINKMEAYTTFEDTRSILDDLMSREINDITVFLEGWRPTGIDYTVNKKFNVSSVLGGKSGLKKLAGFCSDNNIEFYPVADMSYVYKNKLFDGFIKNFDASRKISGVYGTLSVLTPDTRNYTPVAYTISPSKYKNFSSSFLKGYSKSGIDSVSLGYWGSHLNGDYKSRSSVNRQESMDIVVELLKQYSKQYKIALDGANSYAIPYITTAYNLPMTSTNFPGETYDVPFLQMVLDGLMYYSAGPINTSADSGKYLLQCIESKSSPMFTAIYKNVEKLKKTKHDEYYNVDYKAHREKYIEDFNFIREALDGVMSQPVIVHERVAPDVVRIKYQNGKELYINYSNSEQSINGVVIPPMGYKKGG